MSYIGKRVWIKYSEKVLPTHTSPVFGSGCVMAVNDGISYVHFVSGERIYLPTKHLGSPKKLHIPKNKKHLKEEEVIWAKYQTKMIDKLTKPKLISRWRKWYITAFVPYRKHMSKPVGEVLYEKIRLKIEPEMKDDVMVGYEILETLPQRHQNLFIAGSKHINNKWLDKAAILKTLPRKKK